MNARSRRTWLSFQARIAELGGVLIETEWLGSCTPHRVICGNGHNIRPRPGHILAGIGLCRTCTGRHPDVAWAAFRERVVALGGQVVEPVWLGDGEPHRVICKNGHASRPRPTHVKRGEGICRTCTGLTPEPAERAFRERVAELGGIVVEPRWRGVNKPHRVICGAGHDCSPSPSSVREGRGICRTCAGQDTAVAEREFRQRVAEQGGRVVEPSWLGTSRPHRVICRDGHEGRAWPSYLHAGGGLCRTCVRKPWDVVYVVANDALGRVKFGVTAYAQRRLGEHRMDGYGRVVKRLDGIDAAALERAIFEALRLAEIPPVQGREYYDLSALPVILDIVDNWQETAACTRGSGALDRIRTGVSATGATPRRGGVRGQVA